MSLDDKSYSSEIMRLSCQIFRKKKVNINSDFADNYFPRQ